MIKYFLVLSNVIKKISETHVNGYRKKWFVDRRLLFARIKVSVFKDENHCKTFSETLDQFSNNNNIL